MIVYVEKLHPSFSLPEYQTEYSACFDIAFQAIAYSAVIVYDSSNIKSSIPVSYFGGSELIGTLVIMPGDRVMVPTGLKFKFSQKDALRPEEYSIRIHARSGLALKNGLTLANGSGIIDADYQEELFVPLVNTSQSVVQLKIGDRIAQGEIIKNHLAEFRAVDKVTRYTERSGGFGSTGVGA